VSIVSNDQAVQESEDQSTVKILLADPNRMGCQLMAAALRRDRHEVVGFSTTSDGIRSALNVSGKIDVVVSSVRLKDGPTAGLLLAKDVRCSYPTIRTVLLLDSSERATVLEAFKAGATGILTREQPFETVCRCIEAVNRGEVWASSKELRFAIDALFQADETKAAKNVKSQPLLTKREEGVVTLISEGMTNRDISRHLNLSEHTVRNYLFRIFNKVGTSNRLELALYALQNQRSEYEGREQ